MYQCKRTQGKSSNREDKEEEIKKRQNKIPERRKNFHAYASTIKQQHLRFHLIEIESNAGNREKKIDRREKRKTQQQQHTYVHALPPSAEKKTRKKERREYNHHFFAITCTRASNIRMCSGVHKIWHSLCLSMSRQR